MQSTYLFEGTSSVEKSTSATCAFGFSNLAISTPTNFDFGQFRFRPNFGCAVFRKERKNNTWSKTDKTKRKKENLEKKNKEKKSEVSPAGGWRRVHTNTACARLSGFNGPSDASWVWSKSGGGTREDLATGHTTFSDEDRNQRSDIAKRGEEWSWDAGRQIRGEVN